MNDHRTNEQRNGSETAFPQPSVMGPNDDFHYGTPGLTKRELFAAMAMQGLVTAGGYNPTEHDNVAHWAVKQADALLTALDRTQETSDGR